MELSEPIVVKIGQIMIPCPECKELGNHLGTCTWSFMRTGKIWTFTANSVEYKPPKSESQKAFEDQNLNEATEYTK